MGELRQRREPPPLVRVEVVRRWERSARMLGLTLAGEGLTRMLVEDPAASVRLLVPSPGTDELVIPTWNGNEFLLPDGTRPALRTFTPLRVDNRAGRLDIEVVRHPGGAVSGWAETAEPGDPAAISGPGSGYVIDPAAEALILLGDETAMPAIGQLMERAPADLPLEVYIELVTEAARVEMPGEVNWLVTEAGQRPGHRLVELIRNRDSIGEGVHLWAAGEASAMQAIRKQLFERLGLERSRASVRGYWKPPRT